LRTKVADHLRRLLEEIEDYPEWFIPYKERLIQVADVIDADHDDRMRCQRGLMMFRFCKDARSFFNGYERNMRRRYLMDDALRGDVEMIQDASNSDRARIMRAYDNAVELDCMLKDMDGATDDMLKRSETIRDSLREVVMGGRSGIIYRGGTE